MDLQNIWNKLEKEKLSTVSDSLLPTFVKNSKHPVEKLSQALRVTLSFTVAIGLLFAVFIFLFKPLIIKIFLSLLVIAYVLAFYYNYKTYQTLQREWKSSFDRSIKQTLITIHQIVFNAIRFQEKAALYVYPISVTAGFLMGLYTGNEELFLKRLTDTRVLLVLGISTIILTPASYFLAKWMYKVSYDKYLKQLQQKIHDLDQE